VHPSGTGIDEHDEVGIVEPTLRTDHQANFGWRRRRRREDRRGLGTSDAREHRSPRGEGFECLAQGEHWMHIGRRGAAGELGRFAGDALPAFQPVRRSRRVGLWHRATSRHRPDRGCAGLGERLDCRVHRLGGERLEHMHGEERLA
jgi:hypothetical protein